MKKFLLLVLASLGLLASIPSESKAAVVVVSPGYSRGYYYQRHPYYRHHYHHYYHRYYRRGY